MMKDSKKLLKKIRLCFHWYDPHHW